MKSKPRYPFQTRVSEFVKDKPRTGIFVAYGGGKTYLSLKWLSDLQEQGHEVFPCLVLGLSSILEQWASQVEEHSSFSPQVIAGTAKQRLKAFGADVDIFIVNYDFLRSPRVLQAANIELRTWISQGKKRFAYKNHRGAMFNSVIVDESTSLKEARNKRFKSLYALCQDIPYRAILTGKPILEQPEEIFSQMLFMDDGQTFGKSFWKFRDTYFAPGPPWRPYEWELKVGAEQSMAKKISQRCICIPEEEVEAQLPPKRYIPIHFKFSTSVRKRYEQLREDFEVELLGGSQYETIWATSRAQKMHQLCQGIFYTTDGKYELVHTMKLDWLRENVPLLLKGGPLLIWTDLVRLIPLICKNLAGIPVMHYQGEGMTMNEREAAKIAFQKGEVDVLILSAAAGYAGLDLWRANQAVFVSNGPKAEWRANAERRCLRIGSEIHEKITYYDLVVEDSLDEAILEALQQKEAVSKAILKHVRRA